MPKAVGEVTAAKDATDSTGASATAGVDVGSAAVSPSPGCQQADGCPFQGGHWRRHTDKDGTRSTKHEPDGSFWNRSCPVNGCSIRAYI